MIFLSLRFYVKSIFRDSGIAKSAILAHLEALNSVFFMDLQISVSFLKTEIYQKLLIKVSEMAKMVFLDIFGSQKLISRKI